MCKGISSSSVGGNVPLLAPPPGRGRSEGPTTPVIPEFNPSSGVTADTVETYFEGLAVALAGHLCAEPSTPVEDLQRSLASVKFLNSSIPDETWQFFMDQFNAITAHLTDIKKAMNSDLALAQNQKELIFAALLTPHFQHRPSETCSLDAFIIATTRDDPAKMARIYSALLQGEPVSVLGEIARAHLQFPQPKGELPPHELQAFFVEKLKRYIMEPTTLVQILYPTLQNTPCPYGNVKQPESWADWPEDQRQLIERDLTLAPIISSIAFKGGFKLNVAGEHVCNIDLRSSTNECIIGYNNHIDSNGRIEMFTMTPGTGAQTWCSMPKASNSIDAFKFIGSALIR